MSAYYNEIDPYCAQWLRNLIDAGEIAPGEVDERSISDVQPNDLDGFTQCHFFAGIGGWSLALRLAGWPDERPIWTGSCPCQPWSVSGRGQGFSDPRHLWPDFHRLIRAKRPDVVMGEQTSSAAGYVWLDQVRLDLAAEGYACGAGDIPACSIGAAHVRPRIYWLADTMRERLAGFEPYGNRLRRIKSQTSTERGHASVHAGVSAIADPVSIGSTDGLSRPVGIVRAFGNAIVPQLAAEVIAAYMDVEQESPNALR